MFRKFLLIPIALTVFVGTVQAQVATSELVPAQTLYIVSGTFGFNTTSFNPHNPAAIQWGGGFRAGVGGFDGEQTGEDILGGQSFQGDIKGRFYGFRYGNEYFALAGSRISAEESIQGFGGSDRTDNETTIIQLSIGIGKFLSVGYGIESATVEDTTEILPGIFSTQVDEIEAKSIGLSLKLGSIFFLGYAQGKKSLEISIDFAPFNLPTLEGDFTKAGFGFRRTGDFSWYFEIYVLDFDPLSDSQGNVNLSSGIKFSTAVFQGNFRGLLLGLSTTVIDPTEDPAFLQDQTIVLNTLNVGWAPETGFSVTARAMRTDVEDRDPFTGDVQFTQTINTVSLAVALQF